MLLHQLLERRKIILGSASPRRRDLLSGLEIPFEVETLSSGVESYDPLLPAEKIPEAIAESKSALFHRKLEKEEILITADTIVVYGNNILGKPQGREDAYRMLKELSGKTHRVITGVCIRSTSARKVFSASSEVTFQELSDEEIFHYIDRYSPFDKAGSYGIQEWIGYTGITSIKGSYFNIVGLPVQRLHRELIKFVSE